MNSSEQINNFVHSQILSKRIMDSTWAQIHASTSLNVWMYVEENVNWLMSDFSVSIESQIILTQNTL